MGYCVVVPRIPGYVWSKVFDDLMDLLVYSLWDLGYEAVRSNMPQENARNIVIGCHLLGESWFAEFPKDTIVINTEQVGRQGMEWEHWNANILAWSRRYEVWDYSSRNIETFSGLGITTRKLQIGYHPRLRHLKECTNEFDGVFYGCMNPRRATALHQMRVAGLKVLIFQGLFGVERDRQVERGGFVVNIHHYDAHIFEIVRCFYLMANGIPILSEVDADTDIDDCYRAGVYGVPYDGLVDAAVRLSKDTALCKQVGQQGYDTIRALPMTEMLKQLL